MPLDKSKPGLTKCISDPITNITQKMFKEILDKVTVESATDMAFSIGDASMTACNVIFGIANACFWIKSHLGKKKNYENGTVRRMKTVARPRRHRNSVFYAQNAN